MSTAHKLHVTLLVIVNFVLFHYVVSSIPLRFDMTEDNIYSLSESTESLLSKIEEPVSINFYYSRSAKNLPIRFKNFANRVEQMLKQYAKASDGKVRLSIIDPKPDTPEEDAALASGLHGEQLPNQTRIFLGLVASQADAEKTIAFFDWNRESFLEYDLSKLIHESQQLTKPRLGLLTSLPLQAPPHNGMPGQPPPEDQYVVQQWSAAYDVESIDPTADALPENLDILAIINPAGVSDSLLYDIDQFILSGKPAFIAVDPSSRIMKIQSQQQMMGMGGMMGGRNMPGSSSDLPRLFDAWGIEYDASQAIGDPDIAYAQGGRIQPAWLIFRDAQIDNQFKPLADINAALLIEAGSFSLKSDTKLTLAPAMQSTPNAGQVASQMLDFTQEGALLRQLSANGSPLTIAGLISGEFPTAFPDGKPHVHVEGEEHDHAAEAAADTTIKSGKSNVFLIADTDWLMDQFSIRRINFLGQAAYQPLNDNQAFAANLVDFLGGSQDLIGLRGKGTKDRSFDVVQKMEVEAQQAYQIKLQAVEAQLSGITQQIQEIASKQEGSGLLVATPELQDALKKHREEEAKLRSESRSIRLQLRSGIEALKTRLMFLNIGLPPLLLALFGYLFYRMRSHRAF